MSSNKTIIPGMEDAFTEQQHHGKQTQDGTCIPNPFGTIPTTPIANNQKPIIGFLYSISKSTAGEFWPLRIGSNSIGRSADCDVCLGEATVSEQHAILVVRQMKNPEKIIASMTIIISAKTISRRTLFVLSLTSRIQRILDRQSLRSKPAK